MAQGKSGGGSIVKTGRIMSANMTGKGMDISLANTPMKSPMTNNGPSPKTSIGSTSSPTSAIAPKVQGSKGATTKDPMKNGQGRKLGNHW